MKPCELRWWRNNFTKSDYKFNKITKNIKNKTYLTVGGDEDISCIKRAKEGKNKIKNSHLTIIKGAQHNIGQEKYLKAVKKIISRV